MFKALDGFGEVEVQILESRDLCVVSGVSCCRCIDDHQHGCHAVEG